jgi:predicted AAA+ superfamily ATPase
MAVTNNERVGRALDLLKTGLRPHVERELKAEFKDRWIQAAIPALPAWQTAKPGDVNLDVQALLNIMWDTWQAVFKKTLGPSERSLVSELQQVRNKFAHQKTFTGDDTYRALDSTERLLTAISSPEADAVRQMREELLRLRFEEQLRGEKRKEAAAAVAGRPAEGLPAWRDLVEPHPDVSTGKYSRAEFAADLWQVAHNEGVEEYRDPIEFFRRTYITEGLKTLLSNALVRLNGQGGDSVVELQTNFGGGKTHSMLALYHMCGQAGSELLPGMDQVAKIAGLSRPPKVKRAVIVGQKISPAMVHTKPDGTKVRTLWGELAWQLGGKDGYAMVREADERGVAPGDLTPLLKRFEPCLILIDEWIAYVRQLYNKSDLPAGDFDAHFTFAQALTESAKNASKTMLVASIPASDNEIGGEGGREALRRLKNVIQRVETVWRPATAEESFEIVRRRLFQPMKLDNYKARDFVVAKFYEEYRRNPQEYPAEASKPDYEKRIRAAYPIHPELFDRLYKDWGTLDKFQLTRGVLRLLASVVHSLWEKQDRSLMVLPASIPMDDHDVVSELTKYLEDQWRPVIEQDVDGPESLPLRMDRDNPLFGKISAARRVARSLYLGSAPTLNAANKGLEDRQVKLACVQPGESSGTFGDALRKLADQATHLYVDGSRYWFSTRPSVNRIAEERAERLDIEDVREQLRLRLRQEAKQKGGFPLVQACPAGPNEVADETEAKLVILGPESAHDARAADSVARKAAAEILDRGGAGRQCANMLVFAAADKARLAELEQAVRQFLAWQSIEKDPVGLNLDESQKAQAEKRREQAEGAIRQRIPEAYSWLLVPEQPDPQHPMTWREIRVQGSDSLADRASKRLIKEALLVDRWAGTLLRMELDKIPLWRANHVSVKQLIEDFAKYPYLTRLKDPDDVLLHAIAEGCGLFTWEREGFAYADSYDEAAGRYRGLKGGARPLVALSGLVVKTDIALAQFEQERETSVAGKAPDGQPGGRRPPDVEPGTVDHPKRLRRFYGTVSLDPARMARDASRISEEIVQHFSALSDAGVSVRLEITAEIPSGAPENIVRTVTENCRTLKFSSGDFEEN